MWHLSIKPATGRHPTWPYWGFFVTLFPTTLEAYVSGHGEHALTRRLPSKSRFASGAATCCAVAFGVAILPPDAFALSFGGEQVSSYLGQPLRLTIPLLGATGDALEPGCFRVVTPSRNDGLAVITQARIELQTSSSPPLLIVRSTRPVDDPVVRVSIEAGCGNPIRRDYTLLIDPPSLQVAEPARAVANITPPLSVGASVNVNVNDGVPSAALIGKGSANAASAASAASADATARAERSERARAARDQAAATKARTRDAATNGQRSLPKSSASLDKSPTIDAKPAATRLDQLRVQEGAGPGNTFVADASLAALAVPRLKIASDLPSFEPAPPGTARAVDELQALIARERRARLLNTPIEEDLSPRLEADLVVAKRRLAELQSQLRAAGLTPKTDVPAAAATAAAATASAKSGGGTVVAAASTAGWNWREWLWVPGVLLVLGLLGFLLRQKRAQSAAQTFSTAPPTLREDETFEHSLRAPERTVQQFSGLEAAAAPAVTLETSTAPATPAIVNPLLRTHAAGATVTAVTAEREASDRLNNPLFQLRDTTRHVDVTELSQVTDEAQVYVDLGRSDQAIEILRDHIEQQVGERDSPAAWLMIFDLYRRINNRAGYDELAPKFRTHFNGRMPDWDNYGHELALDDGLEAFPHLVAMLQRDWGTPDARKFLEELLYDNRGGSRLGFSLAAYRDILLLLQLHEAFDGEQADLASIIDWESRGANDDDGTPKWDLSLEMLDPPKPGELESFLRNKPPDDKS